MIKMKNIQLKMENKKIFFIVTIVEQKLKSLIELVLDVE